MAFKPGQSGNPKGRPRGTSPANKLRRAINDDLPEIIQKLVSQAIAGDTGAAKLLLDRAIPPFKSVSPMVTITGLKTGSLSERAEAVVESLAKGNITLEAGQTLLAGLASLSKIIEVDDLERRITELEAASSGAD